MGHRWIDLELVYEGLLLLVVTIKTSASDSSIPELFCELAGRPLECYIDNALRSIIEVVAQPIKFLESTSLYKRGVL